jgi:hypothetical protein
MTRLLGVLAVSLTLTWTAGCSDDADGRDEPAPADVFRAALQGSWTECKESDGSRLEPLTFSGLQLTVTSILYSDLACAGSEVSTSTRSGTVTIGSAVTANLGSSPVTALQVDFTVEGTTSYDLAYVDTAATPDRLHTGDKSGAKNGSTPALRPTELWVDRYLVKD